MVKFSSILRLLEMIPEDIWKTRGRNYAIKLANSLEEEGYKVDSKLVLEKIDWKDGKDIPMATQDSVAKSFNVAGGWFILGWVFGALFMILLLRVMEVI